MSDAIVNSAALERRFGRKWALRDCTLTIPSGRVAALVGPNGAGKSTFLRLAAGLSRPTSGSISVLGETPGHENEALLRRVGYLDQERPLYRGFRVDEMFRFGASTNPTWHMDTAHDYVDQLAIPLKARVGSLSGGQQAQVALTMCLAKQPDLLLLDEPAAALDPVAREDSLRLLMRQVAEHESTVVLSTHALSDVASICDYLVILSHSRVVLADDIEFILQSHRFITMPTGRSQLSDEVTVLDIRASADYVTHLVRLTMPLGEGKWEITEPTLEEIILPYLRLGTRAEAAR